MRILIENCDAYNDFRGDLIQFVTNDFMRSNDLSFGQVYLLTFEGKNVIRGNHYHTASSEIFCLISGEVEMVFEDVNTKENMRISLSSSNKNFKKILIGENVAHAIKSISDFAVLVSFSTHQYSAYQEDKYEYILIK